MTQITEAEKICQRLSIPVDVLDRCDFRYLERRGYRFCVDFGTENAAEIVERHHHHEFAEKTRFLRKDQVPQW